MKLIDDLLIKLGLKKAAPKKRKYVRKAAPKPKVNKEAPKPADDGAVHGPQTDLGR